MIVDDVKIFLLSGAEYMSEKEISYYVGIEKAKLPQDSLKELHLQVKGKYVYPKYFAEGKRIERVEAV